MATKESTRPGNIREFVLSQAKDEGKSIDIADILSDVKYYEDVLSNSISLTVIIAETGGSDVNSMGNTGILDGLPVRGGEPCNIVIEDHAYIGAGAIIKQGEPGKPTVIGQGAVVGMGAVVTKSISPGTTVVGNPAQQLVKN